MTQLRKDQRLFSDNYDSMVLADLCAFAAVGASILIYLRHQDCHMLLLFESGMKK